MRFVVVALLALLNSSAAVITSGAPLEVDWLVQYGNETLQTAHIASQPRMIRNISNSLMTAAPSYLDGSIFLQRRSDFVNLYPELNGIGETSQEWLRAGRVTLNQSAVVVAAMREDEYPGAGSLLTSLGWHALGDTITLGYNSGVAHLALYAGLVDAGPVDISGAGVNDLRISGVDVNVSSDYFFFQSADAFSPTVLAQLQSVSVPEPAGFVQVGIGAIFLGDAFVRRNRMIARKSSTTA